MNPTDMRVLVVEDDPLQRRVACAVLRDIGTRHIVEAGDGGEALERLRTGGDVDVAVCDLEMAGMDGVEFLRRLGAERSASSVVLLTALEGPLVSAVEDMARESGLRVAGSLRKPLTRGALAPILDRLSGKPGPARSPDAPLAPEEIARALRAREFVPFFQPKVAVDGGGVAGAEALVRWRHPELGLVSPARFIGVAEANGLIVDLTWAVLDGSLGALAAWNGGGLPPEVSVNLSPRFLENPAATDGIVTAVESHRVAPERVVLEVTESLAATDLAAVLANLARLRMRGYRLSIDDFGTGYASLEQLRRVPFSELKVDRSFVNGAGSRPEVRAILESSLDLGRRLGLKTTAEGVETAADLRLLRDLKCDLAQGFLIARPMPDADLAAWAKSWRGLA